MLQKGHALRKLLERYFALKSFSKIKKAGGFAVWTAASLSLQSQYCNYQVVCVEFLGKYCSLSCKVCPPFLCHGVGVFTWEERDEIWRKCFSCFLLSCFNFWSIKLLYFSFYFCSYFFSNSYFRKRADLCFCKKMVRSLLPAGCSVIGESICP